LPDVAFYVIDVSVSRYVNGAAVVPHAFLLDDAPSCAASFYYNSRAFAKTATIHLIRQSLYIYPRIFGSVYRSRGDRCAVLGVKSTRVFYCISTSSASESF
jgi:hypothetical protein